MSKSFTLNYPDGSKGNISASEREHMLLAGEIQAIDDRTYKFIGKPIVLHSFLELARIIPGIEVNLLRRFYPGMFVWELGGKRNRELLESPEAMALRMRQA